MQVLDRKVAEGSRAYWGLTLAYLHKHLRWPEPKTASPRAAVTYFSMPRVEGHEIAQPAQIEAHGDLASDVLFFERSTALGAKADVLVSPRFLELLRRVRLPPHSVIECEAVVRHSITSAATKGPFPFRWLWWHDELDRVDFEHTTFDVHYEDGAREQGRYSSVDDFVAIKRRGFKRNFVLSANREDIVWTSPAPEYDLDPDILVSPAGVELRPRISNQLAEQISAADLAGVRIRPVRLVPVAV